jgi:hypothetical protein
MTPVTLMFRVASVVSFSLLVGLAGAVEAQAQDFMERLSLRVEGAVFQPKASGSVFDLATSELTLGSDDFRHVRPGAELQVRLHDRLSVLAGWSSGAREVESTIRQGTGTQTTSLDLTNALVAGLDVVIATWGDSSAWRASTNMGVGRHAYRFEQRGTFPDASRPGATLQGSFLTEGSGDLAFLGARIERRVSERAAISLGARYQWSEAEVSGDYRGFAPLSLSGLGMSTGVRLNR